MEQCPVLFARVDLNAWFQESRLNSGDVDYKFTPEFASGALFSTSLLDTLVCQAFYNVKIMEVVNKLIGSVDNRSELRDRCLL